MTFPERRFHPLLAEAASCEDQVLQQMRLKCDKWPFKAFYRC